MKRIILSALLALVTSACSTDFYRGLAEDSIVLKNSNSIYFNSFDDPNIRKAQYVMAEEYCSSLGKTTVNTIASDQALTFECR